MLESRHPARSSPGSPYLGSAHVLRSTQPESQPLSRLLARLNHAEITGEPHVMVKDVAYDSSKVRVGSLFFCVPGSTTDGHDFAADAVRSGATALVVERQMPVDATQVIVPSVREAMAPISAEFFGRPADRMTVVGVTGTNGKTTSTYLMESVFRAGGMKPGVIGTTGVRLDGEPYPAPHTTPEAPDIQRLLRRMRDEGIGAVAMEVSSHGLDQHRADGIGYACSVFTNLTQDHLDYHGTMEDYFLAKSRLFTPEMSRSAAINRDDPHGLRLIDTGIPTVTYGRSEGADVRATEIETGPDGIRFRWAGMEVRSRLRGMFNVMNCLGVLAASRSIGTADAVAREGIAALEGVPGRLEPVVGPQPFPVLVDYAHTPDSLDNVLRAVRPLAHGKVIVVFGCGGDRDHGKRPLMGERATALADLAIITSDNPRSEDPGAIIAEVIPGAQEGGGAFEVEPDRRAAIRAALTAASVGDVVVIAGKGHETGQEFADRTVPFDDRIVASEEIRALQAGPS